MKYSWSKISKNHLQLAGYFPVNESNYGGYCPPSEKEEFENSTVDCKPVNGIWEEWVISGNIYKIKQDPINLDL